MCTANAIPTYTDDHQCDYGVASSCVFHFQNAELYISEPDNVEYNILAVASWKPIIRHTIQFIIRVSSSMLCYLNEASNTELKGVGKVALLPF